MPRNRCRTTDYIPEVKITPIVPATQEYQPLQHHPQHAPSVRDVISQRMGDRHEGHSYPRPSYAPGPSSRPTTHRSHKRREDLRTDSSQAAGLSEQASPSQAPTITGGTRDGTATKPTEQVLQNLRQAVDSYDTASYQCGIDGCETVLNNETSAPHMRSLHYPLPDDPEIFVRTQRLRCRYTGCSADIVNFASLHRHLQTQHWQLRLECPVCQQQYNRPDNLTTHMLYRHPAEYSLTVENATPVPAAQKDQLLQHHMQDTPSARGVVSRRMQDKHEGPPYPGPSYTPGPGSSTTTYHAHQQGEHLRSYPSQTVGRSEQASRSKASQTAEMRGGPAPNQTKQALPKPRKAASLYNAASYRCGIDGCETVLNNDTSTPHIRRLHYPVSGDAGPSAGMQILRCRYMGCNTDTASFSHLHRHLQSTHWELTVTCPVCQRPYSRPDNLKEHLKIIHPEYSQAVANPLP
ncbi:hypothetical protein C2E23DRAFT_589829 [Lenzites betulinus]|nr:hypothetical protein C2E23DRAFT_589829 [Lenzites betulinus]